MVRQKLDPDVFLRIHIMQQFNYDKKFEIKHSIEEEVRMRENEMEYHQLKKKNNFLDFLTNFS